MTVPWLRASCCTSPYHGKQRSRSLTCEGMTGGSVRAAAKEALSDKNSFVLLAINQI